MFNDWNGPEAGCHLASAECKGELHGCALGWHLACDAHSQPSNGEYARVECLDALKDAEREQLLQDAPSQYEISERDVELARAWFHLDQPAPSPIAAFISEQLAMEACFV